MATNRVKHFLNHQAFIHSNSQHFSNPAFIRLVNKSGFGKVAFLLCFLFCKDMAFKRMLSFDLACAGKLESLLRPGFRFNFWHYYDFTIKL